MASGRRTAADGLFVEDHFVQGDNSVNDSTDYVLGDMRWWITAIANNSTYDFQTGATGVYGDLRSTTAATADGDGSVIHTFTDGLVLDGEGGRWYARVKTTTTLAGNNFRIGVQDSVTATRPTKGITIESDAGVLTCRTDSAANGDFSQAVSGLEGTQAGLTSGTTMVVDVWNTLEARWAGENANGGPAYALFYVNGVFVAKLTCALANTETVELSFAHWQDSGGAAARIADLDYFGLEANYA